MACTHQQQQLDLHLLVQLLVHRLQYCDSDIPDTHENLYAFFIGRVRDRLHVILCLSPVGATFARRAQQVGRCPKLLLQQPATKRLRDATWPSSCCINCANTRMTVSCSDLGHAPCPGAADHRALPLRSSQDSSMAPLSTGFCRGLRKRSQQWPDVLLARSPWPAQTRYATISSVAASQATQHIAQR